MTTKNNKLGMIAGMTAGLTLLASEAQARPYAPAPAPRPVARAIGIDRGVGLRRGFGPAEGFRVGWGGPRPVVWGRPAFWVPRGRVYYVNGVPVVYNSAPAPTYSTPTITNTIRTTEHDTQIIHDNGPQIQEEKGQLMDVVLVGGGLFVIGIAVHGFFKLLNTMTQNRRVIRTRVTAPADPTIAPLGPAAAARPAPRAPAPRAAPATTTPP